MSKMTTVEYEFTIKCKVQMLVPERLDESDRNVLCKHIIRDRSVMIIEDLEEFDEDEVSENAAEYAGSSRLGDAQDYLDSKAVTFDGVWCDKEGNTIGEFDTVDE